MVISTAAGEIEVLVNTTVTSDQIHPSTMSFADGGYLVLWKSVSQDSAGDAGGIYFQRYDADGNPVHADGVTAGAEEVHVNTTISGDQDYVRATALADGKFVITWTDLAGNDSSGEGIFAQLYDTDGTALGSEIRVNATTYSRQTQPTPTATADGGFIITWASDYGGDNNGYSTLAQRFDGNGNFVAWDGTDSGNARAETTVNTTTTSNQAWSYALALDGGQTMFLYSSYYGGSGGQNGVYNTDGSTDLYGKIYNADGSVATDEFRVNSYLPNEQYWPHAIVLNNGDVAVTWMSNGQDGSGQGLYGQIVHPDGTFAGPEFRVNTTTSGDQENYQEWTGARMAALANGGFVVTWHTYTESDQRGVYYQLFDAQGNKVGSEVQANYINGGDQSWPDVVATSDGFTLVWDSQNLSAQGDGEGYGIVTRHFGIEATIAPTGGEDQVNTHTTYRQQYSEVASASDGSYVVVWQSDASPGSGDGGDGSGQGLYGQRYNADGTRAGSEFLINQTTAGDQASVDVAYLDGANDGMFVVTWTAADSSGSGIYARVYNADGTAASGEFLVNANTQNDQGPSTITALHGANAGGFLIAWSTWYDAGGGNANEIYAQRFDDSFAPVNGQFRVTTVDGANTDQTETGPSVIGTTDGGYIVQWNDSGSSYDYVSAKRYDASDNPLAGTNPDGSSQSYAFQVNQTTANIQASNGMHHALGSFADGAFVSVWQSQYQDGSNWGVYAQVYNADGTILTPEFRVNTATYSDQSDASVAVLADGSFVVVWTSLQGDLGDAEEIYAKRFDRDGNVLNQEFVVNTINTAGYQRWPTVAATADGFVVTWTDQYENSDRYAYGNDGSSNGVFKQQFTIDQLNATAGNAGTAHKPVIMVEAATAHEVTTNPNVTDNAAELHFTITPDAAAAGTESTSVEIAGIPVGATLSDGTNSFTASAFQTAVNVDGWNLSALTITPALGSETSFALSIRATSTDSVTHDSETTTATLPVTLTPVALPAELDGPAARVNSTVAGNQTLDAGATQNPIATWADGSYVIVWTSRDGQDGSGDGVFAQKFDADGNPVGGEIQVNTFTNSTQASPSVAALADGSFVVTWESYEQAATAQGSGSSYFDIYARTFDSTGAGGAEVHVNSFTNYYTYQQEPSITVLADGGYLIAWQSSGQESNGTWGTYAQRFDADGNMVSRDGTTPGADEIHLNTTEASDQTLPVTTALQDGGWLAVWNSYNQDGSYNGIYAQRFDAAGNMVHADGSALGGGETGAEFLVNSFTDGSQQEPAVITLADGGWVISWQDDRNDGSSWGSYGQVYNSDGSARGGQFQINTYTGNDQSQVSLAAGADGGFFAVFHSYQDSEGYGIYGQQFDAQGQKVGQQVLINDFQLGAQEFPHVAATADGVIVAWQSNYYYGPANGQGVDLPNSWGIFAKRMTLHLDHVTPVGGENQVHTTSPHEQQGAEATTLANGDYVVVWQSKPSQSSAADHDISDWGVYGQIYHADGTRAGGEFLINSNTDGDQSQPDITALDNGGFVVVWTSATGSDGSGYGVYGQRYDNAGAKVGAEFLINATTSGTQDDPSVEALHGPNAGGFVVTWDAGNADIFGRVFDANGAGTPVAVGGEFAVNVQYPDLNGSNYYEHDSRIAAGSDGGFTVVWHDDSTDGSASGVFGQRFTADLATGAQAVPGSHPDGSTAPDNFRLNHDTYSYQWNPDIAFLSGGGAIAVWQSDVGDQSGSGIRGQFYNADGTLNGTEFQVNTDIVGQQYEPRVLALSDGTFVVAWRSNQTGSNGTDIYANHFAADGRPLDDQFRVNATTVGDQSQIALTESENGFVVTWTSPNQDGSNNGVFEQRFVIDPGPSGAERAVEPTLTVSASSGDQDSAIALHIDATLNDSNVATPETLRIEISNIPAGATIADGSGGHSFTSDARATAVDVAGWNLAELTITPPAGSTSAIDLTVRATAAEPNGDIASVATTAHVTVDVVTPPQAPYGVEFVVDDSTARSDSYPEVASFADGSFVEVWQVNNGGVGHGIDVMARLFNADGTAKGDAFLVNPNGPDTSYYSYNPTVAVLADGTFTVAWQAWPVTGDSGYEIRAQRFSAAGDMLNPDGTPGQLARVLSVGTDGAGHDAHANDQTGPQMTALADGSYIVVWMSAYQDGGTATNGIYATRIDASGNVVQMIDDNGVTADVIHVSNAINGDQNYPSVIELTGGNLVFAYDSPDASYQGTFYRLYDPATGFGPEVQINSYTNFDQSSFYRGATLAALADGGFAAVWSSDGQDGSYQGIYGEVFNADGTVRHAEFQVSSYALNQQQEPQITSLPDGGFMAVWTSNGQDGDSWGVYGQRFDAAGDRVGTEFRLNTTISSDQSTPDIVVQGDGSGVIVTWEDNSNGNKVVAERIPLPDASTPQAIETAGAAQQVNLTTNDQQVQADVVKLADGSYVVAWQSYGQDGNGWGVYARHYDAAGHAIQWAGGIDELQLSTSSTSNQTNPKLVALADGSFIAGWQDDGSHGGGQYTDVFVRHIGADGSALSLNDASGTPTTSEIRVNSTFTGSQYNVDLTALANGGVAITWMSDSSHDGSGAGIYGTQLQVDGGNLELSAGPDTLINTHVSGDQSFSDHQASTATLTNGEYVVVWQSGSNSDGSGTGVYGQLMNADGTPHGPEFLINTETYGEQVRPSVAALSGGGFVVVWDGDSADSQYYGIAGQMYDAAGNPVGGQFQIDAVAQNYQYNAWVEGAQDGGFVVAWRSDSFDGSGSGIALRRFDASGHASDPYGDDVLVNVSYSLNDQDRPAIAALDNGLVVVWQSYNQDGSSWGIEQQRFQGAGLEPPPLIVDQNATANGTTIFNTIQDAVDAANSGDIIEIVGGADAASAVVFNESVSVSTTGLTIRNQANTFVVIQGDAGNDAIDVAAGAAITIKGDAAARLVVNAGESVDAHAAIHLEGSNDGSVVQRVTVNAGEAGPGLAGVGSALLIEGGQNGILAQFNVFGGHTSGVLANVLGASSGGGSSTGVSFVSNSFNLDGGSGLTLDATGSNIKSNAFNGTGSESGGALVLLASGDDIAQNTFGSAGTPHILDPNGLYSESTLISQNSFATPWVWDHQRNGVFSTMGEALAVAQANDYIETSGGSFAFEATPTVGVDNLTVYAPASESRIVLDLGTGVTNLTLAGSGGFTINGNDEGDTIHANDGAVTLNGGAGNDLLFGGYGAGTFNGGGGTDTITILLGYGVDTIDAGGDDDDTVVVNSTPIGGAAATISESGGTVTISVGGVTSATIDGTEVITYDAAYSNDLTITGFAIDPLAIENSRRVNFVGDGGTNTVDASGLTGVAIINSSAGDDTYIGGPAGLPTLVYTDAGVGAGVIFNLSSTAQTVGAATVAAGTVLDEFGNTDTVSMGGALNLITGNGDDSIWGGAENDIFTTGDGTDVVRGGSGNDLFNSSAGTKDWYGDAGDDQFFVSSSSIAVHESAGEGTDLVYTDLASYTLTAEVENLTGTSTAGQTLNGNASANIITTAAGSGNDTVDAGDGNDTIVASGGTDSYTGGIGNDTLDFSSFASSGVTADISLGAASGTGLSATVASVENLVGTGLADVLMGDGSINNLTGGGGDDTLRGGGGNDVLAGGNGSDTAEYVRGPSDGLLHRDGFGGYTFDGGAGEGTDTLTGIETIRFAGANNTFGDGDDYVFQIVGGNVALRIASDTGAATEAGGLNNATAATNATGNLLANDINLDEDASAGDTQRVTSVVWTGATGPGSGSGTTTSTAVTAGGVTIQGRYGSLTIAAGGAYTYTPDASKSDLIPGGTNGVETFTYTADDGSGTPAQTTLTITLAGRNDTPVASDVATSGGEDAGTIASNLSATDVDQGAALTYALVAGSVKVDGTTVADGTVTVNSDGSYSYATGAADNALNVGETRTITFSYTASDGTATSPAKVATITVNGANDAPTANADTSNTSENTSKTVDVLANDSDPDTTHVFTLVSASAPAGHGTANVVSNQVQFVPGTDFDHLAQGAHEDVVISYTMQDDHGVTSSSTLTMTVNGVNDAPASSNASVSGTEDDASIGGTLTASDVDDGAVLTFGLVAGTVQIDGASAADGTVTVNADGSYSYTPGADDNALNVGEHRTITFDFSVSDGIATIQKSATITVNGANDAPTANADTASAGENTAIDVNVLGNDSDPDTTHVFTLDSATAPVGKGTASVVANQLHFAPGSAFDHLAVGALEDVVVSYQMEDDNGAVSSSTLTVTVNGVNDGPSAVADSRTVFELATASAATRAAGVLGNDTDPDDGETATLKVVGAHAGTGSDTAVAGSGSTTIAGTYGTLSIAADGSYSYTPDSAAAKALGAGVHASETFHYTIQDAQGATSASTLVFDITGINDAPSGTDATVTILEDAPRTLAASDFGFSDVDGNSLAQVEITTLPSAGTLTLNGAAVNAGDFVSASDIAAGQLVYRPVADANGTGAASFTFQVQDDGGTANGGTDLDASANTLTFDITPVNDAPAVTNLSGDAVTYVENSGLVHFDAGSDAIIADIDSANFSGGSLTLQITGGGVSPQDRLSLSHTALISNSSSNVTYGGVDFGTWSTTGSVLTFSFNSNATVQAVQALMHAVGYINFSSPGVTNDNPTAGTRTVTWTLVDGDGTVNGGQDSASFVTSVTVQPVDDAAVARNDAVTTDANAVGAGSLFADNGSGADSDVDGPALAIAAVNGDAGNVGTQITLASGALLTVNADGSYSYDPNGQFDALAQDGSGASNTTGSDSFTYTLAGGGTATVTIDIHGVASAGDRMEGTAGGDAITGTAFGDLFMLEDGGSDSATGGEGDDGFYMGASLDAGDNLDGGAGTLDQVGLQGDYSGGLTLGAGNLVGSELLVLLSGSDTRFGDPGTNLYDYDLTTVDANVAAGERLVVSWNTLQAGEDVTFDGSAETDGYFLTYGGLGVDHVTGGQQDDGFYFGVGRWGASDSVDGQGGTDDQLGLQGDYSGAGAIVFGSNQLAGIEVIVCLTSDDVRFGLAPGDGYSYDLTMNDGNVGAGQTLYISANTLQAANGGLLLVDETLTFDGSAETDGAFGVFSGAGADTIVGGAGDDQIWGGGGADTLTGGAGNDIFSYGDVAQSSPSATDHIVDFATGDRIDLSTIDAVAGGSDDAFVVIGGNAFSNTAGELRYELVSGNDWLVMGDTDGDGSADFQVQVTIADGHAFADADFVL